MDTRQCFKTNGKASNIRAHRCHIGIDIWNNTASQSHAHILAVQNEQIRAFIAFREQFEPWTTAS